MRGNSYTDLLHHVAYAAGLQKGENDIQIRLNTQTHIWRNPKGVFVTMKYDKTTRNLKVYNDTGWRISSA